jgi:hypothetical protein
LDINARNYEFIELIPDDILFAVGFNTQEPACAGEALRRGGSFEVVDIIIGFIEVENRG